MNGGDLLVALIILNNDDWDKTYHDISVKKSYSLDTLKKILAEIPPEITPISILDTKYPEELKKAHKPPFAIFEIKDDEGSMIVFNYKDAVKRVKELKKLKTKK